MSDNSQQTKRRKNLAAKNDKNMKRYSENEKSLLYELFERYQEIIDIKLRRNLYSSTKQCEVRECWELILKTFNEDQRTSERTMKQLQKFWLNAKLRRMIPNSKYQSESNSRRTSSDSKLPPKAKPIPRNEGDSVEDMDSSLQPFQHQDQQEDEEDEAIQSKHESEREDKPQIFNIKYVVPSNLIIREHPTQQHATSEPSEHFPESTKVITPIPNDQQTDEFEHEQHMQDDSAEVLHDNENSISLSNQEKIDSLRIQEMENRVCESQLRCEVQKLIISKAAEEFKHMQEMNKLQLQEAKLRLSLLERNCANGRGNIELLNGI